MRRLAQARGPLEVCGARHTCRMSYGRWVGANDGAADRYAYEQKRALDELVEAMNTSLQIAENAREDAQRSERHSRIISWSSVGIAVASLAVAIVAVFVQSGA